MRIVVADCSADYSGRLTAHLPMARRLIVVKADGTVLVHGDAGHKALNWMPPPCVIEEGDGRWTVLGAKGERLDLDIDTVHIDTTTDLGREPGLVKVGSEDDLQELLAAHPETIEPGLRLVRREHPTDIGPVDLLCEDHDGRTVAVEVKRVGDIDGVEQLRRYLERLSGDGGFDPLRGVFVATVVKPQARTLAASYDIGCVEVDFDVLAGLADPALTLF